MEGPQQAQCRGFSERHKGTKALVIGLGKG